MKSLPPFATIVTPEPARSIISRNKSPDISFDQSINPYRGCEHGCIYCYARPSHAYLNLSPGLDFETKLFYKPDAARLLEQELGAPGYRCSPITIGANTDPYQPIEREYRVTRSIIEVLAKYRHPFSIITKSALIERDIDLLAPLARDRSRLRARQRHDAEQRTQAHARAAHRLARSAPANDSQVERGGHTCRRDGCASDSGAHRRELERILKAAAAAGARAAAYVLLRLAV